MSKEEIERLRSSLPELPDEKKLRFVQVYGLPDYDASVLTMDEFVADFFESCVKLTGKPKETSNWIMTEMLREMKDLENEELKIKPEHIAELIKMVDQGEISIKTAKEIFPEMFRTGKMPSQIVEERGLKQLSDERAIFEIAKKVIDENPQVVSQYRSGKKSVLSFFVGQVMKQTRGTANPKLVNEALRRLLEE